MDLSVDYIKMCEKAVEVQELLNPKKHDWIYWPNERVSPFIFDKHPEQECGCGCFKNAILLPRQDQLQEMVMDKYSDALFPAFALLESFYRKLNNNLSLDDTKRLKSFEQLWLGYVMYMKFNKTWNGGDWE